MREPTLAATIAKELRRFHEVDIPDLKEPQLWTDLKKFFEKGLFLTDSLPESFRHDIFVCNVLSVDYGFSTL